MPIVLRRWQAQVELETSDEHMEPEFQIVSLYGETIDALRATVRAYLLEHRLPLSFNNVGDHIVGYIEYELALKQFTQTEMENSVFSLQSAFLGFWRKEMKLLRNRKQDAPEKTETVLLKSYEEAVDDFVATALIPEKGPDYHSKALVGSNLRLPLLEKVLREAEEHPINDLIQRGWHIIALEYKGELSNTGELTSRKAVFVMGHPEQQAALLTLHSPYFDVW